jgi:DNA-binding MarR family transcriptional regulator
MAAANAGAMHPLTFGMKRMFLRSVAINRGFTKQHHLTPARFDMLVAIRHGRIGAIQRNVRWQLGVASPTVSRMMRSLEKLGYIRRCKYPPDRRHRWVTLTDVGRQVIDIAQGDLTYGPFGENVARGIVSRQADQRAPTEKAIAEARTLFRTIRYLSGDTAVLRYPPYFHSGERMPQHDVPFPGEHAAWLWPPPGDG